MRGDTACVRGPVDVETHQSDRSSSVPLDYGGTEYEVDDTDSEVEVDGVLDSSDDEEGSSGSDGGSTVWEHVEDVDEKLWPDDGAEKLVEVNDVG